MSRARVQIRDLREWDPELSRNGGRYSYTTVYEEMDTGEWTETHSTSAEFEYCQRGLGFQECSRCQYWEGGECGCGPEISAADVLRGVVRAAEDGLEISIEEVE